MNSYHLGLAGAWWFLALLLIFAAGMALFVYRRTVPEIPVPRKILLISLRLIALFLFLFVLFEPIFTMIRGTFQKPVIAVLVDNSLSMALSDASGNRKDIFKKALETSGITDYSKNDVMFVAFDAVTKTYSRLTFDSLKLSGQLTDISKAFGFINDHLEEDNIGAVVLFSDGAYNSGDNPVYRAEQSGKKVYAVGIGDTNEPKDVSVQSIITNDIAYVDNSVPVNVNVKITGYKSGQVNVVLTDNGLKSGEQSISVSDSKQEYFLIFEYKPTTEGIRKLNATVTGLDGEITQKNNTAVEFINVLKNKRRIVIFAGSPNPDLTFLRNIFESEKGVEVKTFIQKQGAEYFEGNPTKNDLHEAEMIVVVGFPISTSSQSSMDLIRNELAAGKPLLFIASQYIDYSKLKILDDFMPFTVLNSKPQEFLAIGDFKKEALSNPLLKINGSVSDIDLWNQLPPVFRTETFVKVKPESEILATIKVNNTPMKEPLIVVRSFQNKKTVAVLGYGLFRWKLLGYAAEVAKGRTNVPDIYTDFIQNAHRWLSINQDYKNVVIKTTKKIYTKGEIIEFYAQIYDASYSPVDNATVSVKITSGNESNDITLNSIGNGRYTSSASGMKEGDYYYSGDAKINGNLLGKDNGRFTVGELAAEYLDLKMNKALLTNITQRTGGRFYLPADAAKLKGDLNANQDLQPKGLTLRSEYSLWHLPWLLAIAILCLALEWFMRKRSGMV